MFEINRSIGLEQIPQLITSADKAAASIGKDDISYATDLGWKNKWKENDAIVPIGDIQTRLIFDAASTNPILTTPGEFVSTPGEHRAGKRHPSFVESLQATERRLTFLREYLSSLPENVLGVISGGSMSYGRFHNVRDKDPNSADTGSDFDLLIITSQSPQVSDVDQMVREDLGFLSPEREEFRRRVEVFQEGHTRETMDILSHKFNLPRQGFAVDMHVIPLPLFEALLGTQVKQDVLRGHDTHVRLKAYKASDFPKRVVDTQRDFYGNDYALTRDIYPVPYGKLAFDQGYLISSGNFVPGMYHNQCSPMFEVALDREGIADVMDNFYTFMRETIGEENERRSGALLSNSHLRSVLFSKHIKKEVDQ